MDLTVGGLCIDADFQRPWRRDLPFPSPEIQLKGLVSASSPVGLRPSGALLQNDILCICALKLSAFSHLNNDTFLCFAV